MNPAYLVAGVQLLILIVLAIDRWVHRVTGAPSMEARVHDLERLVALINEKGSEHHSTYMAKIINLEGDVRELKSNQAAITKAADNLERRFENRKQ